MLLLQAAKKGQETSKLEREYRDCMKSRRDKIRITRHIMMHQVLYTVQLPNEEGDMHIIEHLCIMICLVILILSLLLFIYSLSKLHIYLYSLVQEISIHWWKGAHFPVHCVSSLDRPQLEATALVCVSLPGKN